VISFEIKVNGKPVSKFGAIRVRTEVIDDVEMGIYGWTSWKPGPDDGPDIGHLEEYTTGEVAHDPHGRVEELASLILQDWEALRVKTLSGPLRRAYAKKYGAIETTYPTYGSEQ
jgi:hypothetical protein